MLPAQDYLTRYRQQLTHLSHQNRQNCWQQYPPPASSPEDSLRPTHAADLEPDQVFAERAGVTWTGVALNDRHHIAWTKGRQVLWLRQRLVLPETLMGYPLGGLEARLALTWWAELAQVFVGGVLVQTGDLFDHSTRILLSDCVAPGQTIDLALRLVSPHHDNGALVKTLLQFEVANSPAQRCPEPSFVAQELGVLQGYLSAGEALRESAPGDLDQVAALLPAWTELAVHDRPQLETELLQLGDRLSAWGSWLKQRRISLVGHAHLDLAWLWPIAETWQAAEHTFASVLALQRDFPELVFGHSTPALYAWIQQHRPDLFQQIQAQIRQGKWEVIAGLWVEPDLVLTGGEAIARHLLYGQRYGEHHLGQISRVAWLPDTFGFGWQLPQLLRQAEIDWFVTQKLTWNDTTPFPHALFRWQAPDGTSILSLMSASIGTTIDPLAMADYAATWETKTGIPHSLWLPGVGNHGGGPSRDMLEMARRWGRSGLFPSLDFMRVEEYLGRVRSSERVRSFSFGDAPRTKTSRMGNAHQDQVEDASGKEGVEVPVYGGELYLQLHRGCYTTHGDQKWFNRRSEGLLYEAELFAALATLMAEVVYPKAVLEKAWKQLLFNQFHDILPGSSIPEVFVEANRDWQEVQRMGSEVLSQALGTIAAHIQLSVPPHPQAVPFVVFNGLNWSRSQIIALTLPTDRRQVWEVRDVMGRSLPTQVLKTGDLLFRPEPISGVGYALFWLCLQDQTTPLPSSLPSLLPTLPTPPSSPLLFQLENEYLQVTIDPDSGYLRRVFDKSQQREMLRGLGNQLQLFRDQGQYWDAWNIAPDYQNHALETPELVSIDWVERGELRSQVHVIWCFNASRIEQDYVLEAGSPLLKMVTQVDWQETHVLLKVAFPLNVWAKRATYEMACGAIERPTQPVTPEEAAQWEVPAHRWADLSDNRGGVSLLNDCKYGYDASPDQLRLTLLRSPVWPDPHADRGLHQFTYALYPHSGSWQEAKTVHQGYGLNHPLQVVYKVGDRQASQSSQLRPSSDPSSGPSSTPLLPPQGVLLNLGSDSLVLMALKQSEDDPCRWILRCYESEGEMTTLQLQSLLDLQVQEPVNLLERSLERSLEQPLERSLEQPLERSLERSSAQSVSPVVSHASSPDLSSGQGELEGTIDVSPWQIRSFVVSGGHPLSG